MKIIFATHNKNKLKEIATLLPHIEIISLDDIQCFEDIPETADTLEGNAQIKTDYVTQRYGLPCFADDTGLLVNALDDAPGVYSARYAGENGDAEKNIALLLKNMGDTTNRNAYFKTVICLNLNGAQHFFSGICHGEISTSKKGDKGFGYDPIFVPKGYEKSFAEMNLEEKNKISHRARATQKLISFLQNM